MALDADLLAETILDILDRPLRQLSHRIDDMEKRLNAAPVPRDGKDADPAEVAAVVAADLRKDLDGMRADPAAVADLVRKSLPEPVLPPTQDEIAAMVSGMVAEAVAALPKPADGKDGRDGADADPAAIKAMVAEAVAAIPRPQDGRDGKDGEKGDKGDPGEDGKDGVGLAGAMIDRDGGLVVTLTNGAVQKLGPVVGKDGEAGKDGSDGLGFEDLDVIHDGERGFTFRWGRGERVVERSFVLPVVLDRGVYASGKEYQPGDAVTYGGSLWIAQEPTDERPDGGKGWRLAVKKGRDGRDGELRPAPDPKPVKVR